MAAVGAGGDWLLRGRMAAASLNQGADEEGGRGLRVQVRHVFSAY